MTDLDKQVAKATYYDNKDSGLVADDVQEAIDEINIKTTKLEDKYETKELFEDISGTTAGTVTTYTGISISQDTWAGESNAIAVEIQAGRPTQDFLFTAAGELIEAIIDASGNYTLSGTPTASDYAICWITSGKQVDYANAEIPQDKIIAEYDLETPLVRNSANRDITPIIDSDNLDMLSGDVKASTLSVNTDYIETGSEPVGTRYWDPDNETTSLVTPNGVVLQDGQELAPLFKNQTGSTIPNGTPVMFAGAIGVSGRVKIQLAIADGSIPAGFFFGLTTQEILNGEDGKVTVYGAVRGIKTNYIGTGDWGTTWVQGDVIYVSADVAGVLTNVRPSPPNYTISVGTVQVIHATQGQIGVRPNVFIKMTDLSDTNGTPLTTDGQFPSWDESRKVFDFHHNIHDLANVNGFDLLTPLSIPDLSWDDITRTFSFSVKSGESSFYFWVDNNKFEKTTTQSIQIPDITGTYYLIFDNDGVLVYVNESSLVPANFYENAIAGLVYWGATAQKGRPGVELHGKMMDARTHAYNHLTFGARYESGLNIIGLSSGSPTYTNTTSGYFWDEDIRHTVNLQSTHKFLYRLGTDGEWAETVASNNVSHNAGGTYDVWNEWTGTTWQLTEGAPTSDFWIIFNVFIPALDEGERGIKIIGQNAYSTVGNARAAIETELNSLKTEGLPTPEMIFKSAWIVKRDGNAQPLADGSMYVNLVDSKGASGGGVGITAHPDLSLLQWTSSGHTGTADTIPAFGSSGEAVEITEIASTVNSSLTGDGTVASPLGINLGNTNIWTIVQSFLSGIGIGTKTTITEDGSENLVTENTSTTGGFITKFGDVLGVCKRYWHNASDAVVAYIDSFGNATFNIDLSSVLDIANYLGEVFCRFNSDGYSFIKGFFGLGGVIAPQASLHNGGGQIDHITEVTAAMSPYTVLVSDRYLNIKGTTTQAMTIVIPAELDYNGRDLWFKDFDGNAGTNNITVQDDGTPTTLFTISTNSAIEHRKYDDTSWGLW